MPSRHSPSIIEGRAREAEPRRAGAPGPKGLVAAGRGTPEGIDRLLGSPGVMESRDLRVMTDQELSTHISRLREGLQRGQWGVVMSRPSYRDEKSQRVSIKKKAEGNLRAALTELARRTHKNK